MNSYVMACPSCQGQSEVESHFIIRLGDRFNCACGKSLLVKTLGNPLQMEVMAEPKFSVLKDKK